MKELIEYVNSRMPTIDVETLIWGLSCPVLVGTILFFFPHLIHIDHAFLWFAFPVLVVVAGIWDKSILFAIAVIVLTATTASLVTSDYRMARIEQRSNVADEIQSIVQNIKETEYKSSRVKQAPVRPYIVLKTVLNNGNLPHLERTDFDIDAHVLGDLAPGIDPRYELFDAQPDFDSIRSVVLVASTWRKSERMIKLDVGQVPEYIHHVKLFVLDMKTHEIVWSSEIIRGYPSPSELKGSGPGGIITMDRAYGEEVEWSAIERALNQVPWE